MITVLVHRGDSTSRAPTVDPAWLRPDSGVTLWVDIAQPDPEDRQLLTEVFHFHELSVEDALAAVHHPKIESYDSYLYLILHGIAAGKNHEGFVTQDVDFFLGPNYLVTVRHETSRSIEEWQELCDRHSGVWTDGAAGLMHRIVDLLVDHYRPEVDALEDRLEDLERVVFEEPRRNPLKDILLL